MGVFAVTAISSILAYVWLYICLEVWTKGVISLAEAIITFSFFWILIILAFIADKIRQRKDKSKRNKLAQFNVNDFYHIINLESDGAAGNSEENNKHKELQNYLKKTFKKDKIEDIKPEDIEKLLKPQSVVNERLKYRKIIGNMISGRKKVTVAKGEKNIEELKTAKDEFEKHELNPKVGFRWLHYSVTESAGCLTVKILKKDINGTVSFGVRTIDGTANAGVDDEPGDYESIDVNKTLIDGEIETTVRVKIVDDEGVEPDEDFYIELYDLESKERLPGEDTKTTVTILDDDKPGIFGFEKRATKVRSKDEKIRLKVMRLDGWDDDIKVKYETFVPDYLSNPAQPGIDYLSTEGFLIFETGETMKIIEVPILPREPKEGEGDKNGEGEEDNEDREDIFVVKISEPQYTNIKKNSIEGIEKPKLGKKSEWFVEIVGDTELLQKTKGIEELIEAMKKNEKVTWARQFKNACMLSPQLDENNNMTQVSGFEALLHFLTIGWKVFFAIIPPPNYCKGWLTFICSLWFIGFVTAIVGEMATLFGCVIGLKPAATAITLVALGTSLPDTFASKQAAQQSEYADSAIGNVTGSNSVNVFLGLGLPWLVGAIYSLAQNEDYKVSRDGLSFSVMLFLITSISTLAILILRRIFLGGELGGMGAFSKYSTAALWFLLWIVYIVFSCLRIYNII